jgi:hypothetical protein
LISAGRVGRALLLLVLSVSFFWPPDAPVESAPTLELYGTFNAMGVIVSLDPGDDPDEDGAASLSFRPSGAPAYQAAFTLTRVSVDRFVGSLFRLEPGESYDVRVELSDPDGGPMDGVVLEGTAGTRAEVVVPAPDAAYYVSPAGSGTACSLAAPCSLAQGIGQAMPGEAVVLRGGIYRMGEMSLPRSGAGGSPIIIQGYPGESAILDGADPQDFPWAPQGGGVYHTNVNVGDTHLVLAGGERLYPYQSLSDLQSLIWGIPGFYASGTDLYVRLAGDADPNPITMTVSRYNHAFTIERNYIYLLDLTFRYYGQGSYPKALYLNNANDNLIRGCTFAVNDLGIGIKRDSGRNLIEQNEFYDTVFDWPWDAVKAGSGLETGGVRFYDPATGRGNVIRGNTFHDYFDGFGVCPDATAAVTNETDVYENTLYNIGDDGMEADGQCSNLRVWGNTFHDVLIGISFAPVYTGPVYAIRNLVYNTGAGNNSYSGGPFKFNSGYAASGTMYLFHNTAAAELPGNNGLYIKSPGAWDLIYARNNIWSGTDYAIDNYNTAQPVDLDYDDLWRETPGDLVVWDSAHYATLGAFTSGTGQEVHGLSAAPGFMGGGDYTLAAGSDLIDEGEFIPGINDGYSGTAPDIGAFERVSEPGGFEVYLPLIAR